MCKPCYFHTEHALISQLASEKMIEFLMSGKDQAVI